MSSIDDHQRGSQLQRQRQSDNAAPQPSTSSPSRARDPVLHPSASGSLFRDQSISTAAMPQYTSRDVGDPSQIKKNKQSMADLKLRRLTELNNRLREDLERERIPVSTAAKR